jgi:CDGSH-type Zn-finger protein
MEKKNPASEEAGYSTRCDFFKGAGMPATKITVRSDGSLRVEGDFELVDLEGRPYGLSGRTSIGLCRCGHSANKPFCDGAHKTAGFQDKQQARDLPPPKV